MKNKNFNTRTCIITKNKKHKSELIRLCLVNNKIIIDEENKILTRGYYIAKKINLPFDIIVKKIMLALNATIELDKINKLRKLIIFKE